MSNFKIRNTTGMKQQIEMLYWQQKLSMGKIASYLKVSLNTIHQAMIFFKIPRRSLSDAQRPAKIGKLNPMWKGENISFKSGRCRALSMYPQQACNICDKRGERHHKDGNTLNNQASNIEWLCRKHHMIADGRYFRWMQQNSSNRLRGVDGRIIKKTTRG